MFPRLSERVGSLGRNLSGGEQQMVAIGRAMMPAPKVRGATAAPVLMH